MNQKKNVITRICITICVILWICEIVDVGLMGAWQTASLMVKASLMMAMLVGLAVYLYCDKRYQELNNIVHQVAKFNEDKRRLAKEEMDEDE